MSRTSWLNKYLTPGSSRKQRRHTAQKRKPVRLAVEPLEDRVVLNSSVIVGTGQELATAINANNTSGGNVTITLANSFTLKNNSTGTVEISKGSVTILGQGNTLTAAASSRLFQVDKGASLTVNNATLTGGDVASTFFGTAHGGAILDMGGKVTLSGGTVVASNIANANGPLSLTAEGGGVFVSGGGSLTITGGSVIRSNTAVGTVDVNPLVGHATNNAAGGGVFLSGGSTLSVTNSSISGNAALGSNANAYPAVTGPVLTPPYVVDAGDAVGGGVFIAGVPGTPSKATFSGARVYNNTAQGGAGVTPSTTPQQTAMQRNGTAGGYAAGGGIYASSSSLSLTGTLTAGGVNMIYGNKALGGAGGDAVATAAIFSAGSTGGAGGYGWGGGVYDTLGTSLLIRYTAFSSNTAQGGMGGMGGNGADSAFTGHKGGGGGVGGSAGGGGAYLNLGSSVLATIVNSSFTGDSAFGGKGGAGGMGGSGTLSNGANGRTGSGGSAVGGGVAISATAGSLVNIINTTVATNTAQGGGSTAGFGSGGGVWFLGAGSLQVINDTVYNNSVAGGGTYTSTIKTGGLQATATGAGTVAAYNTLFLNNTNSSGYADTNLYPQFATPGGGAVGAGNYITSSFLPTIKVVSPTSSDMDGLIYYALEAGTDAVNGGVGPTFAITGGTLAKVIAGAEGVSYNPLQPGSGITDEIGQPRFHNNGIFGYTTDAGAVSFQATSAEASTTVTVGNVNITASNVITPLSLNATVTATNGNPVTEGKVVFTVETTSGTVVGSPVPGVMTGPGAWSTTFAPSLATTYTLPGNTPPGTYYIIATYTDPYNPAGMPGNPNNPLTLGRYGGSDNTANPGLLTISAPAPTPTAPTITKQPDNATVVEGSTVLFTAAATGVPAPSVQWYYSTDGGTTFNILNNGTNVSGATTGTLSLSHVTTAMSGYEYEAKFTNTSGSATTTAALLTVTTSTVAPTITIQPTNQAVVAGNSAVFTAGATGTPTPSVQWYYSTDGGATFNVLNNGTNVSGATTSTLSLSNLTTAMSGYEYEAKFTNTSGSATTNAALLTVTPSTVAPTITIQPTNQTAVAGTTAVFTAAATGTPTPSVQWYYSTDGGNTFNVLNNGTNVSGATTGTLTLSNLTTAMSGYEYEAKFTNSAGSATTTAGLLTVNAATVAPTITLQPKSATVSAGNTAVFTASATGNPTPSVQWFVSINNGATFSPIVNYPGVNGNTLTITNVPIQWNGYQYRAVYTNSVGSATTNSAQVTVTSAIPTVNANVLGGPVNANVTSVAGVPVQPPSSNPLQFAITVALDTAALLLSNNATAVSQLNNLSLYFLGTALPPTSELLSTIQSDLHQSAPVASFGMQLGYSLAGIYSGEGGINP